MDFLNKAAAQLGDLFRSMTPGARITAGLLLAVVVVSLVYLFSYQMSPSDTYLMGGRVFNPEELGRAQAALGAKNLTCTADGMKIKIPSGREAEYMAALAEEGALPRGWSSRGDGIADASPWESSEYRKQRIKMATEEDLSFSVKQFTEVENARVIFDKTTEGGFRKRVVTSASVAVATVGGRELSQKAVDGIRDLVAGSLPPMKPEDVKVINTSTCTSYYADNGSKDGIHGNRYLKLTRDWEEEHKNKILKLLDYIPGIKASVAVRLDPVESLTETKITPDTKGTPTVTQEKEITRDREAAAPSGRPGYAANMAMTLQSPKAQGSKDSESESQTTTTNIVGTTTESKTYAGMTPTWMSATVIVPRSYLVNVWKEENATVEGAEAKQPQEKDLQPIEQRVVTRIRENVSNLLPDMKDVADKTQLVTVSIARDIRPEPIPEPSLAETAVFWLSENWRMLGIIVLALGSLYMLRSMVRSTPLEQPAARSAARAALTLETGESTEEVAAAEMNMTPKQRRLANFAKGGSSLRDELSDLVKEDPDVAANILRSWIGTSSMKA